MRIRTLFLSMVAGLAFVGCSSEEDIAPGNNGELSEPQFLTVNLVTNPTNGTRAGGEQHPGDPTGATYEEGLEAENKVTKVRFYFFDANGNAAKVKRNGTVWVNYLEWENNVTEEEDNNMPNVEKILTAQLIIETPKEDKVPDKIVAIINPMTEDPNPERSLASLIGVTHDAKTATSGNFLMSNSTYAKDNVKQMAVSAVGKIKKTPGEALDDPVDIYVERAVAKVRLNSTLTPLSGTDNIFKTSDDGSQKVELDEATGEQEIYVKFLGWNATAVSNQSRLVKEINPNWSPTLFGADATPWNWAEYCRCFWAINAESIVYEYGAFVPNGESGQIEDNKFQAQAKKKFDGTEWVYVNENASPCAEDITTSTGNSASTPTKVIISAQLVDKDGNALEFAEYGSTRTTIEGLKNLFANNCGLYKKNEDGTFVKIHPNELTVKTATEAGETSDQNGKPDIEKPGRYKSYVQLAADEDNKWYASNTEDAQPLTAKDANTQLKKLGSAKVWRNGFTYYYFDIRHFGDKIGVVRNHIYDAKITSLAGLGTPVYNPDEIIYPEKPVEGEESYIAAQIHILSWRVVKNDVELNW